MQLPGTENSAILAEFWGCIFSGNEERSQHIEFIMALAADNLRALPRKLNKSLKKLQTDQSPERVHKIRTRTRRLEAMLHALAADTGKNERSLLKAVKPVRKKAGKVRDADVLIAFASQIRPSGEQNCSVRLLEHLGAQRFENCKKLEKVAAAQGREIKQRTKRFARLLDGMDGGNNRAENSEFRRLSEETAAHALQLSSELRKWPSLSRSNLHPFRLKAKELRYLLQMAEHDEDQFVRDLGEVKDAIGEWHDWEDLAATAEEVIKHRGCKLVEEIRTRAQEKLGVALDSANRLRKKHLAGVTKGKNKPFLARSSTFGESAMSSASALAA